MDPDPVLETGGGFGRWIGAMVGVVAVTAALLAILQADASRRGGAEGTLGGRLAAEIFVRTAASSAYFTFRLSSLQDATAVGLESTARQLALLRRDKRLGLALARAEQEASDRLARIAERMGELPSAADGVDPRTRRVVASTIPQLQAIVQRQNAAIDTAERYGLRGQLGILGLTLSAIAGALLGVAGIFGRGRAGRLLGGVATATWLGAVASGAVALTL